MKIITFLFGLVVVIAIIIPIKGEPVAVATPTAEAIFFPFLFAKPCLPPTADPFFFPDLLVLLESLLVQYI